MGHGILGWLLNWGEVHNITVSDNFNGVVMKNGSRAFINAHRPKLREIQLCRKQSIVPGSNDEVLVNDTFCNESQSIRIDAIVRLYRRIGG